MNEPKYTPGPWMVEDLRELDYWFVSQPAKGEDADNDIVAQVYKCMEEGDGRKNAELIAAAPLLFEALRDVVRLFDPDCEEGEAAQLAALSALAKAEGG